MDSLFHPRRRNSQNNGLPDESVSKKAKVGRKDRWVGKGDGIVILYNTIFWDAV